MKDGKDSRFDEIKYQPGKFTFFWGAQGTSFAKTKRLMHTTGNVILISSLFKATWITLVGLPVFLVSH